VIRTHHEFSPERKSQGTEKMKNRNEILINRKKIHRQGTTKGREWRCNIEFRLKELTNGWKTIFMEIKSFLQDLLIKKKTKLKWKIEKGKEKNLVKKMKQYSVEGMVH
jgi:hypothetical protein